MIFRNWKIRNLMLLSPLAGVLLFSGILWQTWRMQERNRLNLQKISDVDLKVLQDCYSLFNILSDVEKVLVESIGDGDAGQLAGVAQRRKLFTDTLEGIGRIEPAMDAAAQKAAAVFGSFLEKSLQIAQLLLDNKIEEFGTENFYDLVAKRNETTDKLKAQLEELKTTAQDSIGARIGATQGAAEKNLVQSLGLSLLAAVLMMAIYALMFPLLIRPVGRLVQFTRKVGAGDLTDRLAEDLNNEIGALGKAFNEMVANLGSVAGQLKNSNSNINATSREILEASIQQSGGANEQMAAINETSATVNELKETSRQSEQRAQEVVETAARSVDYSKRGSQSVQESVAGMNAIQEQVAQITRNILSLSEQTEAIGDIIATVNDIAEQSNVLAVNASIEAAKAGEYGRGFEVVAREVKSLADQSKEATSQVRLLLGEIKKATAASVMATEQGQKKAESGAQLVQVAGENIGRLSEVIEESARAAKQIAITSHQQSVGIDQIAIAIENIRQTTADSVASVRQTEKAAQSLNRLAQELETISGRYRIGE